MTDPKKDKQENQPEKESTPFAFESEEGPAEQETVAKALAERQMEAIEEIDDSAFELEEDGEVPAPLDGEKAADSSDPAAVAGASQPESAPPEEPLQPRMEEEPFTRAGAAEEDGKTAKDGAEAPEAETPLLLDYGEAKKIVETVLFVAHEPLRPRDISVLFRGVENINAKVVRKILAELAEEYRERPLQIAEVAEGFRMCTRPDFSFWVRRFLKASKKSRLSQASLESLAIIAYKQPITRAEIEQVRRVDCSGVLNTLLERNLIRILGRRDVVGRPIVYGTTPYFLDHFGFRNLADMPRPDDLEGMEALAGESEEGEIVPLADSSEGDPGAGAPEGTEEIPAPSPLQTLQESAELAEADAANGHANGSANRHTHSTEADPEGAEAGEGEGAAEKPV